MTPRVFASVLARLIKLCRIGGFAGLVLSFGGCVILPIPTATTAPRYSSAQLENVRKDTVTQKSVETELLGAPDFRLEAGRIWIYTWTVYSGKWLMGAFTPYAIGGGVHGHVSSTAFLLVLEFDADGILRSKEFAHEVRGGRDRFCTERELCIEHPVYDMIMIDGKMDTEEPHEVYRSGYSAVTVKGGAREGIGRLEPQPGECLLVIWPTKEWTHKESWSPFPRVPGGLALTIEGAQWPRQAWLPAETFAVTSLPAGAHAIYAVNPYDDEDVIHHPRSNIRESSASFECRPGEYTYMAIDKSQNEMSAILLRSIDAATAQALIADMPQVLLP